MRGNGTKLGITPNNPPPARLLDLTRLVSRAGRRPTGVDRVELAYLKAFLAGTEPVFGLVRTNLGYALLDGAGCLGLLARVEGGVPWGPVDRLGKLARGYDDARRRGEADVRRLALARCLPARLARMVRARLPQGVSYVNVGHTNLTDRVLSAVKQGGSGRVSVMIHDTIPLDFPQFARAGVPESFRGMLRRVGVWADLVICNSAQTERDVTPHLGARTPATVVTHLGVEDVVPGAARYPVGFDKNRAYFTTIGTIEPRKDHGFLLDLWEHMAGHLPAEDMPQLLICGARGWADEAVFKRLETLPLMGRHVFEMAGLDDPTLWALLQGSAGLLFPSHAEGFGLPPVEAAMLGVPVVCHPLDIYGEILGQLPIYAKVSDVYDWETIIRDLVSRQGQPEGKPRAFDPPRWPDHFGNVLRLV